MPPRRGSRNRYSTAATTHWPGSTPSRSTWQIDCDGDSRSGGVAASFAFLGDINIAEPKALIGFAGPRVIENTVREKLPEGFQRAEFLLQQGAIDMIIDRRELKQTIARQLAMLLRQPADALV